ncbi:MAG: ATP-binding cassette domain-containing protein [Mycoplasmoidaceae bacterium]|nr:ATP-binding cassette domain-containing protein [Mycoplasmoidaceae bacterium]
MRNRSPNTFSSGQKKKILLAQALIHDPEIIIMDEPVANLDPKARLEFFETLIDLKKQGKAIFISSHVLAELNQYFDSATILDGGKIVYSGTKEKLLTEYAKEFFKIKTSNDSTVKKYLKQEKIEFSENKYEGFIQVYFKDKQQMVDFQQFTIKQKVFLDLFERSLPSLEQVYEKLIVKGSVDTMRIDAEELEKAKVK